MKAFIVALLLAIPLLTACPSLQTRPDGYPGPVERAMDDAKASPTPTPRPTPDDDELESIIVYQYPETKPWVHELSIQVGEHISTFGGAIDHRNFCDKYDQLDLDHKQLVWATMVAEIIRFECSFNPAEASVDVGTASDRNTWSVGLLQLSVVDQESYRLPMGYTFDDLKDPVKNLRLGFAIMQQLIEKDGQISAGMTRNWHGLAKYWSTIRPGVGYLKEIQRATRKVAGC